MDLVKILKGRERCELWSPMLGDCVLNRIVNGAIEIENIVTEDVVYLNNEGKFCTYGQVVLFPSEHQRDWSKFGKKSIESGAPVMVSNKTNEWFFRYYAKDKLCWDSYQKGTNVYEWEYIVPFSDFDPYNIESNKEKSI